MVTIDTNVAVYALSSEPKRERARAILLECDFASVQVFNEYAHVARRKIGRQWTEIQADVGNLAEMIGAVLPVSAADNGRALVLASRYRLSFFDALLLAVALAGGATIFYSEDMQHGLVIEDRLTIINPFLDTI